MTNWKQEVQRQQGEGAYRRLRNTVAEGWLMWALKDGHKFPRSLRKHRRFAGREQQGQGRVPVSTAEGTKPGGTNLQGPRLMTVA